MGNYSNDNDNENEKKNENNGYITNMVVTYFMVG